MQKLLRLRQFIYDTHLFHHDVPVKTKEELSPGPRSPVAETPKLQLWPLQTSIPESIRSPSEESPSSASTLKVQPTLRPLLIPSFPQPSQALALGSEGDCETRKTRSDRSDDASSSGRMSRVSRSASTGHAERKTVWSVDDPFFGRAKPPPPLKLNRHTRNRSCTSTSAPSEMTRRSSILYRAPSRTSLRVHSRISRRDPDTQVLDISRRRSRCDADDERFESLLAEPTRMSKISDSSSFTGDIVFAPCGDRYSGVKTPPPRQEAEPSGVDSTRESDEGSKSVEDTVESEPIAEISSKVDRRQVPTRLNRIRSLRKMRNLFESAGAKGKASAARGPLSPDVVVSIQCYEHNEWHEEAMEDVIPKLRVLRLK